MTWWSMGVISSLFSLNFFFFLGLLRGWQVFYFFKLFFFYKIPPLHHGTNLEFAGRVFGTLFICEITAKVLQGARGFQQANCLLIISDKRTHIRTELKTDKVIFRKMCQISCWWSMMFCRLYNQCFCSYISWVFDDSNVVRRGTKKGPNIW